MKPLTATYLSLGAGGQSTALYLMSSLIDVDLGENGQMEFDWFANECAGVCGV